MLRIARFELDCERFDNRAGEPEVSRNLTYPVASVALGMDLLNPAPHTTEDFKSRLEQVALNRVFGGMRFSMAVYNATASKAPSHDSGICIHNSSSSSF
jgi:hypothetical protein